MFNRKIFNILLVAFLFRFILLCIDQFWFYLPQSGTDTLWFIEKADLLSRGLISYESGTFLLNGVYLFIYFGSIIFTIFGKSPFIWGLCMVFFGVGTVYNVYRGASIVSNEKFALRAAWIIALFPNLAILSAIILREAPLHFFLSLGVLSFIKYEKSKNVIDLVKFFGFCLLASILHSGVFGVFFGFLMYMILFNKRAKPYMKVIIILLSFVGLYYINATGIGLSKFGGSFEGALESLEEGREVAKGKGANYPEWLQIKGNILDLVLFPIRFIAFLFSPFIPFFARTGAHMLGVIDGAFYFGLFYMFFRSRKILLNLIKVRPLYFLVIGLATAFTFGASNFGTNIRHRGKILPIILMIPLMKKEEIEGVLIYNNKKSGKK